MAHGVYSRSLVRALDVSGKHFIQQAASRRRLRHAGGSGCEAMLEVPTYIWVDVRCDYEGLYVYDTVSKI